MRFIPRWQTVLKSILALVIALVTGAAFYLRLPWIRTEPVSFRNGDVTLSGTLALPRWREGPYPAAVVVQGSGSFARWFYWTYAKRLAPYGMAVLIYDKRGTGSSTGTPAQSGTWSATWIERCGEMFDTLAGDALAGVAALKARSDVDAKRIGFLGVSQAGWIMPLAGSRSTDVAFIVNISGPAVTCGMEDWYSQLTGEYAAYPEARGPTPFADHELSDAEIERRLDQYDGPQGYDPVPTLKSLRIPTLWLLGGRDRSVPTSRSVANLRALMAEGAPFDLKVYPEGDHGLMRRDPGSPSFDVTMKLMLFRRIEFMTDVRAWLAKEGMLPPD